MSKVEFAITIGNFDGLHLGHRALIETTLQASHSFAGKSALVTFDPHPQDLSQNHQNILRTNHYLMYQNQCFYA